MARVSELSKVSNLAPALTGLSDGLTFEQHKELVLLQLQQEQRNILEVENLRHASCLWETELAHAEATQKLQLERYRLDLIN